MRNGSSLPADATVDDLLTSLADPQKWFSDVITNLRHATSRDPGATVRIGVSGEGLAPYHLITFRNAEGSEVHQSFFGAKQDTKWGVHPDSPDWSVKSSTLDEVRAAFHKLPPEAFKKGR